MARTLDGRRGAFLATEEAFCAKRFEELCEGLHEEQARQTQAAGAA
jgi:hypothetical protein